MHKSLTLHVMFPTETFSVLWYLVAKNIVQKKFENCWHRSWQIHWFSITMPLQRDCCLNRNLSDTQSWEASFIETWMYICIYVAYLLLRLAVVHVLFVMSLASLLMNVILTFMTYRSLTYSCLIAVSSAVLICYVMYTRLECWGCEFMMFHG